MIQKVISYYNKEFKFYENVKLIQNQANEDIIGSCKRYVSMVPIQEAPKLAGKTIYIIGEFDDDNLEQPLSSYADPVLVVDCDEILRRRFPTLYEQDSGNTENN